MTDFTIMLCGIAIGVHSMFEATRDFCSEYLTDRPPKFELTVTPNDLEAERQSLQKSDIYEGREAVNYRDEDLERTALLRLAADKLPEYDALLFHGAIVAFEGKCYMFTAPSGTGKTTHSLLWLKNIPHSYILNGDKPFLLSKEGEIYGCASPWQGKEDYGVNEILPLAGICLLERADFNHIEKISYDSAFEALVLQSHKPAKTPALLNYMKLLSRFSKVALYRLGCNTEDEAALVCYKKMTENI